MMISIEVPVRERFPEYYQLSLEQINKLSANAVVAFDASFLLDLYRYSADTRRDMFSVLDGLGEQVWLPHQAALEFHRNRLGVVASLRNRHAELLRQLKVDGEKLLGGIRTACLKHPLLDAEKLVEPLKTSLEKTEAEISAASDKHPKATLLLDDDPIWSKLASIFDNKIGPEFSDEQIRQIEADGKQRFANAVPPGFKDEKNKDYPYGDLIIWRQLMDYCKSQGRPAFLVSSDVKQDWWLEQNGKKLGPLPALRKEFLTVTGQDFHLYETTHFVTIYAPKFEVSPEKPLDEIRRVRAHRREAPSKSLRERLESDLSFGLRDYTSERSTLMDQLSRLKDDSALYHAALGSTEWDRLRATLAETDTASRLRKEMERQESYYDAAGIRDFLQRETRNDSGSALLRMAREMRALSPPPSDDEDSK